MKMMTIRPQHPVKFGLKFKFKLKNEAAASVFRHMLAEQYKTKHQPSWDIFFDGMNVVKHPKKNEVYAVVGRQGNTVHLANDIDAQTYFDLAHEMIDTYKKNDQERIDQNREQHAKKLGPYPIPRKEQTSIFEGSIGRTISWYDLSTVQSWLTQQLQHQFWNNAQEIDLTHEPEDFHGY